MKARDRQAETLAENDLLFEAANYKKRRNQNTKETLLSEYIPNHRLSVTKMVCHSKAPPSVGSTHVHVYFY